MAHRALTRHSNYTSTLANYRPTGNIEFDAAQSSAVQALDLLDISQHLPLPIISRAEDLACIAQKNRYGPGGRRKDRLEWLGDKFVNWVVGNLVWHAFPDANACQLTTIQGALTCNATFASLAVKFGMIPSNTLVKAGGDHFEAFVMMACKDSSRGWDATTQWIKKLFRPLAIAARAGLDYIMTGKPRCVNCIT